MLLAYTPHPLTQSHPQTLTHCSRRHARAHTRARTHTFSYCWKACGEISFLCFFCFFLSFYPPLDSQWLMLDFKKKIINLPAKVSSSTKLLSASSPVHKFKSERWRQVSGKGGCRLHPGLLKTSCQTRVAQIQDLSKMLEYAPRGSIPRASGTWSFHAGHLAKGGDNSKKE